MNELTLDEANRKLAADGYPPIKRLPADAAAIESWKRVVDARREVEQTGKMSDKTFAAIAQFCHCLKCPSYPRGEMAVYCVRGKSDRSIVTMNCKCPSCEVYQVGGMHGSDYFCVTGVPAARIKDNGGAKGVAVKFLDKEIDKGNPGKRLPERLMAPPGYIGRRQDDVETPEKVPGA